MAAIRRPLQERHGAVLLLALLILAMVTVMGIYSATKSSIEQRISSNMRTNMSTFFVAEAGLKHAKTILAEDFQEGNAAKLAAGLEEPDWDFLLSGSMYALPPSLTYYCGPVPSTAANGGCGDDDSEILDGPWTAAGIQIVQRTVQVGNLDITYTVTAWDNYGEDDSAGQENDGDGTEDKDPTTDDDQTIYIRSVAVATSGGTEVGRAIQQMTITGKVSNPMSFDDPVAQANFGPSKASAGRDIDEIDVSDLGTSQAL